MDNPVVIVLAVVGVVVVLAILYFATRKPAPALPPEPEAKPLPEKQPRVTKSVPPKGEAKVDKAEARKSRPDKDAKPAADKPKPAVEKPVAAKPVEAKPEPKAAPEPVAVEPEAKPARAKAAKRRSLPPRKRDVEGLRKGLAKARQSEGFFGRLRALFTGKKEIDPAIVEQMEEVLLTSDVGVQTTALLLEDIKEQLEKNELADSDKVWQALRGKAAEILADGGGGIGLSDSPTVVMFVGVNGVGKTTTIGKLATKLKADGKKLVLAAGDTFRAAAVQQLTIWGKRVGCEVVSGKDGANPGAVIFDAIQRAKEIGADVVLVDTAGRLHTKTNLMDELSKVAKTMDKAMEGAPHETLLVLDATNGQNAIQQTAMFKEALPITGIVLTKLDGTAKGGVILGISAEHKLPVRYIGIGERAEDLRDFSAEEFVDAMLSADASDAA